MESNGAKNPIYFYDSCLREILKHEIQFCPIKPHYSKPHFDFNGATDYFHDCCLRQILKHEIQFSPIKPHYYKPHFYIFGIKWGLMGLNTHYKQYPSI